MKKLLMIFILLATPSMAISRISAMTCTEETNVHRLWIRRCENNEVICYLNTFDGGISCKFKEVTNEQ